MAALVRTTSIDVLFNSLSSDHTSQLELRGSACTLLQEWWRKRYKLSHLRRTLISHQSHIDRVSTNLAQLSSPTETLATAQTILSQKSFAESLSCLLLSLPVDPNIKKNNTQARSARFISSAFLIKHYGKDILTVSKDYSLSDVQEDTCDEARHCRLSATMVYTSFLALLQALPGTLGTFRRALVSYRFAVRYFLVSIHVWEGVDTERLVASLQSPFTETYTLLLSMQRAFERGELREAAYDEARTQAEQQFSRIQGAFVQALGPKGRGIIEELKAACESQPSSLLDSLESQSVTLQAADDSSIELASEPVPARVNAEFESEVSAAVEAALQFSFPESEQRLVALLAVSAEPLDAIVYEVCSRGKYVQTLPEPCPGFALYREEALVDDKAPLTTRLRRRLLRVMGDKLISSLRVSALESPEDLQPGMVITVSMQPREKASALSASALSARVLAIRDDGCLSLLYLSDLNTDDAVPRSRVILKADGIAAEPLLAALTELCDRILALTPRARATQASEFSSAVDLPLLRQMITAQAIAASDLAAVFEFILHKLTELQAPVNTAHTLQWTQSFRQWTSSVASFQEFLPVIPSFFEYCSVCIDEIKVDMANYYIQLLSPLFLKLGPAFLAACFASRLSDDRVSLFRSALWLQNSLQENTCVDLAEAGVSLSRQDLSTALRLADPVAISYFVAYAFISLLQSNYRLDTAQSVRTLPETLIYDASKLALIRDEIDILALVSTVLIVVKQTLNRWRIALKHEDEAEFQSRLNTVIRSHDISLSDIIGESMRFVKQCVERRTLDIRAVHEWEDALRKSLADTVSVDNPVRNLFFKRIMKLLLRGLLEQPYQDKLPLFSLASAYQTKAVTAIVLSSKRLLKLNLSIYYPLYAAICKHILET